VLVEKNSVMFTCERMHGKAEKMFKKSSMIRKVDIVPIPEIVMAMGDDAIDSWIFKDSCAVIGWSGFGSMICAGEK
jgi:hypothetical protein